MRGTKHAPRDQCCVHERRLDLPNIVKRRAFVIVESLRVSPPQFYCLKMNVRRQHFSLFAQDKTEKHAWHTTLNTVTNSSREWAYVGHEIKDSCAYITGKKK